MKILMLCLLALSILACANPVRQQMNLLTESYQRGEISANDYQTRMTELQALDLQRRQMIAQAGLGMMATGNNTLVQSQPQPPVMLNTVPAPRTTYGTIYAPGGRMYNYNQTTY